ncbi:Gfo/Idh/MocA family protein [Oceanobacillus sp. CFH 90083]|uniref:Gfo/Idh/MocA family protein n=1 Tax=Oceanobacillus sp. CFH 90083 TaxID=2592336 RepID=UPI00128C6F5A|nr:Gfo/Idh/MocA family oxidoreductase [Oceanobacillus sp. CFH 90083]
MIHIDIKIAVIGLNHGYKFANDILKMDGVSLVGVAGNDTLASMRAKKLQVPLFTDYKDLLEQCDMDGAIITLPNHLHAEAVQQCALKGIAALVEKPIAPTIEAGQAIIQYAQTADIPLLVGHHRRFSNKVNKIKEIITSGLLGDLVGVHMMFALAKDHAYFTEDWRITKGGGPLLINAAHDIDNIRYITGLTIDRVYAASRNQIRNNKVEDAASILLETKEGPTMTYFVSDGVPSPWSYELTAGENPKYPQNQSDCYFFFGTKGSIAFPSMQIHTYDEKQHGWDYPLHTKKIHVDDNDPMTAELHHFIDVIKNKAAPRVTGEDALETLKVVLAIKQAADEKEIVSIKK